MRATATQVITFSNSVCSSSSTGLPHRPWSFKITANRTHAGDFSLIFNAEIKERTNCVEVKNGIHKSLAR